MNIFENKVVIGLFDNDSNVEQALQALQEQGFGGDEDKIKVIDQHRLVQETPLEEMGQGIGPSSGMGTVVTGGRSGSYAPVSGSEQAEPAANELNAKEVLTDLGVDDEEAEFYAEHLTRGDKLIIVETDEEHASKIMEIMLEANAKSSIS